MRNLILVTLLFPLFATAQFQDGIYRINPEKSTITWTGYGEIGSYSLTGRLQVKKGSFNLSESGVMKGAVQMDMKTISHENKDLVKHLKSEDFFYVKDFPLANFQLKGIQEGVATGLLTIRGIAKEISVPVEITQTGNQARVICNMSIDRTEFDIKYNSKNFFQNLGDNAIKDLFDLKLELIGEPF